MPNWCYTNINVYSEKTEIIRDLHEKIKSFAVDCCAKIYDATNWVGNLLLQAGCDYKDIKSGKYGYVEGYVMNIGNYVERDGMGCFEMEFMDKWSPDIKAIRSLIRKLYPYEDINIAYMAQEPGMEIFEKYDPENLFYDMYDYYVDYIIPEEANIMDYPEIIQDIGVHPAIDIIKAFGTDVFVEVKNRCNQITEEIQAAYQYGGYVIHKYEIIGVEY